MKGTNPKSWFFDEVPKLSHIQILISISDPDPKL